MEPPGMRDDGCQQLTHQAVGGRAVPSDAAAWQVGKAVCTVDAIDNARGIEKNAESGRAA